jgi:putative iron-dependent peroxidase
MLENMFVGRPPGNYDRLLDFSRAVTGNLFFVPSATFLDGVTPLEGVPPEKSAAEAASADLTATGPSALSPKRGDGSLDIGSLKGEISDE